VLVHDPVGELVGLSLIGLNLVCFLLYGRHSRSVLLPSARALRALDLS
jgi:hypothetical protein